MAKKETPRPPILNDNDIKKAIGDLEGYVDITPEDFREIYIHAYLHAKERLQQTPVIPKSPAAKSGFAGYLQKMNGGGNSPAGVSVTEIAWSWLGSFLGILAVAFINYDLLAGSDLAMIIGSFGASAVLIYGAIKSPLAQPRNLIGGHFISALIGVAVFQLTGDNMWLASALAVSLAIAAMHATKTLHPPGGATALIAVIGSDKIHNLGFLYAVIPAFSGALLMLIIAVVVNNLAKSRRYPEYWL